MIQRQLKLKPTKAQESQLEAWLWHLTGVWNWAIRKIELDAKDSIYYSKHDFRALLRGHSERLGIPLSVLRGMQDTAFVAWQRCFRGMSRRPRLKGQRNRLNSIPMPYGFSELRGNRIHLPGIGSVRFHEQSMPEGRVRGARIVKRASGWHLCLFIEAEPQLIPIVANGQVGIDPGFSHLLTLSDGTKIEHPRELERIAGRLAQAQRGKHRKLTARLHERAANQRKDRNHKLSRQLVAANELIVWSKDSHRGIAATFGKSVASSAHAQLRSMLAYKCRAGGRQYIEVSPRHSTVTCSACGGKTGPTGWAGLSVRAWDCGACGARHDRDVNAAVNTLKLGVGATHENRREAVSATGSTTGAHQRTSDE